MMAALIFADFGRSLGRLAAAATAVARLGPNPLTRRPVGDDIIGPRQRKRRFGAQASRNWISGRLAHRSEAIRSAAAELATNRAARESRAPLGALNEHLGDGSVVVVVAVAADAVAA